MPAVTAPGFILDQYGRPVSPNGSGMGGSSNVLHRRTADDDRLRPRPPNHFGDYLSLFSPTRYRELVSECRSVASRGLSSALIEQKADYVAASGFRPRFSGSDTKWGIVASAALEDALKICNLRGARFDWRSSWRLGTPTRATDGRFFVLLTAWESGWPALQFLEGHRIGQRDAYTNIVGAKDAVTVVTATDGTITNLRGVYAGLPIHNGVITTLAGTEIAYRLLGAKPEDDMDISARDMIQVASPMRYSEGCPVPDLARALLDFLAIDTAQTCQLDQQISDAKQTYVETNETGRQDPISMLNGMSAPTSAGTATEMIERGNYRYLKTSGKLAPFQSQRPSDQWMNFDMRVAARSAASIRWRVEMLDPSLLKGAATRAFQDQINTAIADEFSTFAPAIVRTIGYFVSKLIGLGVIPKSDQWMCWNVAPPPWFEVDRASSKLDLEDVAAGRTPMSTLHGRDGHTTMEVYEARAVAYEQAEAVQTKHPRVPLEIILGDLGLTAQRTGTFNTDGGATPIDPNNA